MSRSSFCLWQAKRGSILIVSLWILIVLTLLAVGMSWRVSVNLRFVRQQRDRLRAFYLAKAGINRAIVEIDNDQTPNCDSLKDTWIDNEEVFKEIRLEKDNFANVSYKVKDKNTRNEKIVYGLIDEERKININTATRLTLLCLPKITEGLADNIRAWRGDTDVPEDAKDYSNLDYPCKSKPFVNIEELLLVRGITEEIYQEIKDLITVWGKAVNINTASKDVLEVIINTAVKELESRNVPEREPGELLDKIILYRQEGNIFEDINLENKLEPISSAQRNVINEFKKYIAVDSNFFCITATGVISASKLRYKISCVFDSNTKRFLYWNES